MYFSLYQPLKQKTLLFAVGEKVEGSLRGGNFFPDCLLAEGGLGVGATPFSCAAVRRAESRGESSRAAGAALLFFRNFA